MFIFSQNLKTGTRSYTYYIALGRWGKTLSRSLHWGLRGAKIFSTHMKTVCTLSFRAAALMALLLKVEFGWVTKNGCFVTFFHVNRSGTTVSGMVGFKLAPGRGSYGNFSGCWGFFFGLVLLEAMAWNPNWLVFICFEVFWEWVKSWDIFWDEIGIYFGEHECCLLLFMEW